MQNWEIYKATNQSMQNLKKGKNQRVFCLHLCVFAMEFYTMEVERLCKNLDSIWIFVSGYHQDINLQPSWLAVSFIAIWCLISISHSTHFCNCRGLIFSPNSRRLVWTGPNIRKDTDSLKIHILQLFDKWIIYVYTSIYILYIVFLRAYFCI